MWRQTTIAKREDINAKLCLQTDQSRILDENLQNKKQIKSNLLHPPVFFLHLISFC